MAKDLGELGFSVQLGEWVVERAQLPLMVDVARELSDLLGGAQAWVELLPEPRQGFPAERMPLHLEPPEGTPLWVTRRQQQDGRAVFWIPLGVAGVHRGFLAAGAPPEHWRTLGTQRVENTLLVAALHLSHLLAERELMQKVQGRDEFLAIASHELKTPLTAIYGLVQLQERLLRSRSWPVDPDELRAEQERYLGFARTLLRQMERLTDLTNMLLDLSRVQAGRFGVEAIPLDASRALRELVQGRLQILADEAGVQLDVAMPERLPSKLDPLRFDELVTNLVMQAIRASPEGAEVKVELGGRPGELFFRVTDQGATLGTADRQRVFEPYEAASAKTGGLGLGLYLSRQIARLHGGEVRFLETQSHRGNLIEASFPQAATQVTWAG